MAPSTDRLIIVVVMINPMPNAVPRFVSAAIWYFLK